MIQEKRRFRFDHDLQIEAYHFHGIMQKFPNHFHEYYVIGFIESGQRRLSCKNKEYIINTGDLIFFNPFDNHACEQIDNKTLDYRCLNIKPEIMRSLAKEISGEDYLPHFTIHVASRSEQTSLLHQLHQMIMNEAPNIKKEETFYFFLEQLITEYTEAPKKTKMKTNEQKIKTVCQYIEANYRETISLNDLAAISNMNKYSLLRSFTHVRGITPYRYLQTIRINEAKKLLEQGLKPIDAAMQTGFGDQSHFSHFFMDFIGLAPGQYQKMFITH